MVQVDMIDLRRDFVNLLLSYQLFVTVILSICSQTDYFYFLKCRDKFCIC